MLSKTTASKLMITLLSIILVFHALILTQVISYEIVWAGKLSSIEEMYAFETVSLGINALIITILYLKLKNLQKGQSNKIINGIIWAFVFLFGLNTLGNLFATSLVEQIGATGLTLLSTFLCWVIVKKEKTKNPHPSIDE